MVCPSFISLANSVCECKDCTKSKAKKCPGKKKGCVLPNYKKDKNCDDENVSLDVWISSDDHHLLIFHTFKLHVHDFAKRVPQKSSACFLRVCQ